MQGTKEDPERYWASQRTLCVTSRDLKTFSAPPRRLFEWELATIDVIVCYAEGRYWAILKDERYPTLEWTTGKTYGLSVAATLRRPWFQVSGYTSVPAWNKYEMPALLRHGCMMTISKERYDALLAAFGATEPIQ